MYKNVISSTITLICIETRTYVSGTNIYPHMPILSPHAARFHKRRISNVTFTSAHLYGNVYMRVGVARALAHSSEFTKAIPSLGRR